MDHNSNSLHEKRNTMIYLIYFPRLLSVLYLYLCLFYSIRLLYFLITAWPTSGRTRATSSTRPRTTGRPSRSTRKPSVSNKQLKLLLTFQLDKYFIYRYISAGLAPETAAYYGNRAACHMMLMQFPQALEDARLSVQIDPAFIKGYNERIFIVSILLLFIQ